MKLGLSGPLDPVPGSLQDRAMKSWASMLEKGGDEEIEEEKKKRKRGGGSSSGKKKKPKSRGVSLSNYTYCLYRQINYSTDRNERREMMISTLASLTKSGRRTSMTSV